MGVGRGHGGQCAWSGVEARQLPDRAVLPSHLRTQVGGDRAESPMQVAEPLKSPGHRGPKAVVVLKVPG